MKNVLFILLFLNFLTLLNGQTNRLFYKSVFKQADGTPIKNMDLNVLIKISNYNGLEKYSECHLIRTDQNGYGYLWLGYGNDKSGKLENINFESEKHILKILLKDFQVYRWSDIYCTPFSKYPNLPETLNPSNIINESNIFYWGGIKLKALGIGYNNEVLSIEHDDNIDDKAYNDEIKAGKSFIEKLSDEEVIIKSSTILKNYLQKGFVFDLLPEPNLLYSKSISIPNSDINTFQSKIGNLEFNKIYYIRSYITYENDTIYGETAKFQLDKKINVQLPCPNVPKIFDIDGNSYNTVQIGNQCWTKENLKVTKFRDGSLIQIDESGGVTGSITGQTWTSQTIGKRTIYANDKTKLSVYGYLYNWFVVSDSRGICPSGWHVPEREELSLLINFLGGEKTAGSKLKEKSSTLWQNSNLENSNESGFSGIPGGIRGIIQGGYSGIGSKGVWWSSTKYDKDDAYKMELTNNSNDAKVGLTSMLNGFSIRCLKDNLKNANDSIPKISTIQITDVTSNSAQSGGSISSEGGSEIIAKGVVWSRSKRPDILTDSTTREGKGIGSFSSALSGLLSGKKYYVRAYATSKYGTSYGQELSFKTLISSKLPKVETSIISDITQKSAFSGGKILSDGDLDIITKGVVWSKNINPKLGLFGNKTKDGIGNENFISIIDKLSPFETYYVRAYATNSAGTGYGNELTFKTTAAAVVATLSTAPLSSITSKTAVGGGNISSDGGTNVTVRGVVWSTNQNPTVSLTTKTTNGNGIGTFTSDMADLFANTTYYVRAYATNSAGTGYGNELTFKTTPAVVVPTLTTAPVSSITSKTAVSGGNISSDGGSNVTIRGVVWSTNPNPTVSLTTKTTNGNGIGTFASDMIDLLANTTYYVRAYATNSAGTGYGNELTFKTMAAAVVPTLTTTQVTSITSKTAVSGGNISSDGGSNVTIRGVVWSTNPNPTVSLTTKTTNGNGIGTFASDMIDLVANTTYYVRAYATNSAGTGYGNELTFKTTAAAVVPSLSTAPVSSITSKTAVSGGNISSDGGSNVTIRGVVWSTNPNPTVSLTTKTINGNGIGTFASDMVDLLANTTYYVRAYATNSAGTGYGNELTFKTTTAAIVPTLTTTQVISITSKTAVSGGNISSDGGSNVTTRGVVWSTNPNPPVSLTTKTTNGNGIGTFTSDIINLLANTTYYVRAYATNSAGTGYGNEISFKTLVANTEKGQPCSDIPSYKDIDGNTYNTVQIGTQCWTKENLRVSKYKDGTLIPFDESGGTTGDSLNETWSERITGARAVYGKNAQNILTYGYLYNWYTVENIKGLCPSGWHVPSRSELDKLITFLGGEEIAGGKMKSTGTTFWKTPNEGATNESGFSGLPGGYRDRRGKYEGISLFGAYWSSTNIDINDPEVWLLSIGSENRLVGWIDVETLEMGASIRCLKDTIINNTTSLPTLITTSVSTITSTSANTGGNITNDGGASITARGVVWSTNPNPTIALSTKTTQGTGIGTFTSILSNLTINTTYYVRAYATNSAGTGYGNEISFTTSDSSSVMGIPCSGTPTVKDIDGNLYNTVQIGAQCWTKENLRVTKYRDGYIIPLNELGGTKGNGPGLSIGSLSYLYGEERTVYGHSPNNLLTYGYLYSWYVVDNPRGICPNGWHVPSRIELDNLITFLGGEEIAGAKLKAKGTTYWRATNEGVTNESGFSGLPGGWRVTSFYGLGLIGVWWSSSNYKEADAWNLTLWDDDNEVYMDDYGPKFMKYSIRCLKDSNVTNTIGVPLVSTLTTTRITSKSALSGGNIVSDGGSSITARGVVWSTNPNPTVSLTTKTTIGNGIGTFTSEMIELLANTTYYVRAYATNNTGTGYGNELFFQTKEEAFIPTVTTIEVKNILSSSATSGGEIGSDRGADIFAKGIVWSTSPLPTINLSTKTLDGEGEDNFVSPLTNLKPKTTYYVRAYATNSVGTGYGKEVSFTTLETNIGMGLPCPGIHLIKDIDGNTYNTVQIGTQCWTKENLRVSKYKDGTLIPFDESGGTTGDSLNETWSRIADARAVFGNNAQNITTYGYLYNWFTVENPKGICPSGWHVPSGLEWSELITFLGGDEIAGARLKSSGTTFIKFPNENATNESGFSALLGGYRDLDGRFVNIGYYAMFWDYTTGNFNLNNNNYIMYHGDSYLYKGYDNFKSVGASVRCLKDLNAPNLTTTEISSISSNTATSGGKIISDGGAEILNKGVVWSTNKNPSITNLDPRTAEGSGSGSFSSALNNLRPKTTYYVRAYASNRIGIGYGNEISFTTTDVTDIPILNTNLVNTITSISANTGGNITNDGGASITARGVVWSTSTNPTISLTTKTSDGTGIGSFSSSLTNLTPKTTYYVRAYAINSVGTAYGNEISFTTSDSSSVMGIPCSGTPTVKDIDGNLYNTVQIGAQCWTKENLRVTKYRDGSIIPLDESGGVEGNGSGQTWSSRKAGAKTVYEHSATNLAAYGYLYNWYAVADTKGLCPSGWHVPSDGEWTTLTTYLGGDRIAGGKMKSIGTTYWESPNTEATNEGGFSVLPGGYRIGNGFFSGIRFIGLFWSASEDDDNGALCRSLNEDYGDVFRDYYNKFFGASVRCLKD
jgi:uncharacterized protein (TIGR02145 family)